MNSSRPLWPLLTAALIGLPVLYVASFGPLLWAYDQGMFPTELDPAIDCYARPLAWAPEWFSNRVEAYIDLWR